MEHLHGGNLIQTAEENNLDPDEIIDFSANINFLGPPKIILDTIKNNLSQIVNYPEVNSASLKKLIAKRYQLQAESITVANGAAEIIYQLTKVLQPERVMVIDPCFSEYELAARSVGAKIEHFSLKKEKDFILNPEELMQKMNSKIDLLFICNPNNPTAHLLTTAQIEAVIKKAAELEIFVAVDEAFIDFLDQPEKYSVLNMLSDYNNLIILRSMTKLFAIPGLRLGYSLTNTDLAKELEEKRDPWSVNYFSQLAGEIIFSDKKEIKQYIKRTKTKIDEQCRYLYSSLKNFQSLKVYQPTANFIFIDISASAYTASKLQSELAAAGILIRNCDSYNGLQDDYIRVAVKSRKENEQLLQKLDLLLA